MSKVDISSEAVERLAKDCGSAQRDHDQFTREAHLHFDCAATLRAQAERIKELEDKLRVRDRLLPVAKHQARNDALREAAEHACAVIDAHSEYDQNACCDGRECSCGGETVHDHMKLMIRRAISEDSHE